MFSAEEYFETHYAPWGHIGPNVVYDFGWHAPPPSQNFDFDFDRPAFQPIGFTPIFGPVACPSHLPRDIITSHLTPTELNATLDLTATDGHGHADFGTGNPATNWDVQHNDAYGIEGALQITHRQGDPYNVYSVDSHGALNYYVAAGPQVVDPAHHVPVANANRAEWNFNFSVDALNGHNLGNFDIHLKVNGLDLHLEHAPAGNPTGSQSGFVWVNDATHQIVFGDDGGVFNHVSQNSENDAFLKTLMHIAPNYGPQDFHIELTVDQVWDTHTEHNHWGTTGFMAPVEETLHHVDHLVDISANVHVVPLTDPHLSGFHIV